MPQEAKPDRGAAGRLPGQARGDRGSDIRHRARDQLAVPLPQAEPDLCARRDDAAGFDRAARGRSAIAHARDCSGYDGAQGRGGIGAAVDRPYAQAVVLRAGGYAQAREYQDGECAGSVAVGGLSIA